MVKSVSSTRREKPFAALRPQTYQVSAAVVKKKWKRLSLYSQENVRETLVSIGKQTKTGKRQGRNNNFNTDRTIDEVVARLSERLPRMPFPPATNDKTFDFELTLHRIHDIEQQLTENVHSMSVLRAQIQKEEQLLEADKREVQQLQESLKSNDAQRRQRFRHLHPIAQRQRGLDTASTQTSLLDQLIAEIGSPSSSMGDLLEDPKTSHMLKQLRDHLESMQANTAGMQNLIQNLNNTSHLLRTLEYSKHGHI